MGSSSKKIEIAYFGMGCFWCSEAIFQRVRGVKKVTSGYSGGEEEDPTYRMVSSGASGHAEVVKVEFDPQAITYEKLLEIFFLLHDPTTLNRQGNDIGTQYRSIILYVNEAQKSKAEKTKQKFQDYYKDPIVTEIKEFNGIFAKAEKEHIDFYKNNPDQAYCRLVIDPKLAKLREKFSNLLVKEN